MTFHNGTPVWGEPDEGALTQIEMIAEDESCRYTALMADHHKGYSMPIGGVAAYKDFISPSGVGFDIACGNKAVRLDVNRAEISERLPAIMDDIAHRSIGFGMGGENRTPVKEHPFLDDDHAAWKLECYEQRPNARYATFKDMARAQLGSVGAGNHYVDIFSDELGRIWVGVHFGSRGLGHKTATYFLKEAGSDDSMDAPACLISTKSALGSDYLEAMQLAGRYAYAGRDWVCQRVADIIGGRIVEEVHNHHNFAWKETHFGEDLWVVRKGATPAWPGQKGFIGATMCEPSVIVEGHETLSSPAMLYSTVHGAGRVMGRMQAKGTTDRKTGAVKRPGLVSREQMDASVEAAGIELRGGDVDESRFCYKRLHDVLTAHGNSVKVLHTLIPLGVAMAKPEKRRPRGRV